MVDRGVVIQQGCWVYSEAVVASWVAVPILAPPMTGTLHTTHKIIVFLEMFGNFL